MKVIGKNIRNKLLICLCSLVVLLVILFLYFNINIKDKIEIYSINARGYSMNKEFNPDIYEYDLIINNNIVDIICDANSEINGCNISLDLTGKDKYEHVIEVRNGLKTIKYVINIKNETKIEDNSFYIKEVKGNTFDWTNKDINLEVILSEEGNFTYSFDGGNTWQDSNVLSVSSNGLFQVVAMNSEGKLTNTVNIEVDKIDKEKPQITINKLKLSDSIVALDVVAYDSQSGIDLISFNGGEFTNKTRYEVSSKGNYYFEVKDKVGNLADKVYIEVTSDDLKEKKKEESKTYTLTLNGNGNKIEKGSLSCTTTGNSCQVILPKIITNNIVVGWANSSNAKNANYSVGTKIELTGNMTLYAITKKEYTATFNQNGASSIGSNRLSCTAYNAGKCEITMPSITTTGDVIGWANSSNAIKANYSVGTKVELTGDMTFYAITKRTFTATFSNPGLDYLSASSLSCSVYNADKSCYITLPYFNKKGHFNSFWSDKSEVSSNLSGKKWDWNYFKQAGRLYELTGNVTLYPNFNQFHYDLTKNCYKYRTLNVSTTKFIGNTMFEFESGIPTTAINNFMNSMNQAYRIMPWLFTPGKVFIMTESTYDNYSTAYGLTHYMYNAYGGDSYFTIDLQYDSSGAVVKNAIDINAALHELAHAWDSYFYYRTGIKNGISSTNDFDKFYSSINSKLYVYNDGSVISKVETFAGMVTNYYWHVLGIDKSKVHYALKNGVTLNSSELSSLKVFMEIYINISKNDYKTLTIY